MNLDTSVIGPLVRYWCYKSVRISVPLTSTILTDISPIFPISVPFFVVLPFVFLLIAAISVLSLNEFLLATIVMFCKLQKVNFVSVKLLHIKIKILKLPISHRDNLYLKYPSLTDIR
ncbi:hypothetical protein Hanom_Chr01g00018381 [Helianthus anomalus]